MKTLKGESIPTQMQALVLREPSAPLEVTNESTPSPQTGQVLVKVDSSPINPSDLSFLMGTYSTRKVLPARHFDATVSQLSRCYELIRYLPGPA